MLRSLAPSSASHGSGVTANFMSCPFIAFPDPRLRDAQTGRGHPNWCIPGPLTFCLAAEVHELKIGLVEVLQQGHGGLKVVAGLGRDAEFVALDLGLDGLRGLVADELVDLLGQVLR